MGEDYGRARRHDGRAHRGTLSERLAMHHVRGSIAEFIGTFALVFFGAGSIILTHESVGAGSLVSVALAHGMILAVFVTGCMYVSGAQFNPAVSVALILIGKQSAQRGTIFIATQLLAAASAAGMLVLLLGQETANSEQVRLGATLGRYSLGETAHAGRLFGLEFLQTFALMFTFLAVTVDERAHKLGGISIGLVVAACIVSFGPLTGSSMNPARTFGPALYGNAGEHHWVYWVATTLGACAAALVYRAVWMNGEPRNADRS